ncbi:reverse transcriptase domain-containing protein [Trichonephila clavipes]|uniref:Reverse transcriptase domain-containing protein n=1 Tax=Trichonephila clavipes TaxID=2585209 RepID=A0A8X6VJ97_TRICX|nr:reverse transcriptase domain-containing protein [Trichonephila clavipes]
MSDHPELLKQLALEVIDGIPLDAAKIYTDGNKGETNTTGFGIELPGRIIKFQRRNSDHASVFRMELIAIIALIRSKLDYGSVVYSSACKSLLKILDPVHQAPRLCLGAFRTSPVESLYAEAYEPPLDLRRKYLFELCYEDPVDI